MWEISRLKECGVNFLPQDNSFTYTFPPPYFSREFGQVRLPHAYATEGTAMRVSLYLHIPFCEMECSFCSLHRQVASDQQLIAQYVNALKKEVILQGVHCNSAVLESVYIGGGTPTICSASVWAIYSIQLPVPFPFPSRLRCR